jgi:hypothetical protein
MGAGDKKYDGENPGLSFALRVGLSDGKDKDVNERRKQLEFSKVQDSHFSLKIEVDTSKNSLKNIAAELRNSELIRFLKRYCDEYNRRNVTADSKDRGASVVVKEETINNSEKSV